MKSNISFNNLSFDFLFFKLSGIFICGEMQGINSNNVLIFFESFLIDYLMTIIFCRPTIAFIFEILSKTTKKYGLMIIHDFTK